MFSTVFMTLQDLLHILGNLEGLGTYMFFINLGLFSPQYYQKSVITVMCSFLLVRCVIYSCLKPYAFKKRICRVVIDGLKQLFPKPVSHFSSPRGNLRQDRRHGKSGNRGDRGREVPPPGIQLRPLPVEKQECQHSEWLLMALSQL